ncbi:MAG: DUF4232 domain-containing protein [Nesterenkonia sp.]
MRGRRTAGLFAAAVLLAGCAADPPDSHAPSETASGPQPNPPSSIGEASEEEVGTDWKAGPTAQVPEESELSDQQRTEMLRLTATHPHTEDSCEAAELTGQLRYTDAATGSRYGVVLLRNDGEAPCTLQGHPGLGARGEHGHRFHIQAEQSGATPAEPSEQAESALARHSPPVRLNAGDIASADIRWGSALAGAESEWIDTLYVQLTRGSTPLPVHIGERGIIDDPDEPAPDIGTFTTVRIQPFEPVDQLWLQQVRELG